MNLSEPNAIPKRLKVVSVLLLVAVIISVIAIPYPKHLDANWQGMAIPSKDSGEVAIEIEVVKKNYLLLPNVYSGTLTVSGNSSASAKRQSVNLLSLYALDDTSLLAGSGMYYDTSSNRYSRCSILCDKDLKGGIVTMDGTTFFAYCGSEAEGKVVLEKILVSCEINGITSVSDIFG